MVGGGVIKLQNVHPITAFGRLSVQIGFGDELRVESIYIVATDSLIPRAK